MEADSGCKLAERSNAGLIVVMMAFLKALPSVLCDNSNFFVWPVMQEQLQHRALLMMAAQTEPSALVISVAYAP